jgi:sulfate/thiosulfate transport system substrate-binding protein
MRNPIRFEAFALPAIVALVLAGCGGASDETGGGSGSASSGGAKTQVNLVAYSTPEVVYDDLIPAYEQTEAGRGTAFRTSFGASGDQSRAVEAGQKADVVSFSVEPDLTRLEKAGLVEQGKGQLVSTSQVVFIVRKGNPKGIRGWDDLLKDDIEVITPNPFTSGAAKWNVLAAYGDEDSGRGLPYLTRLVRDHVKVQPKSGREALQAFLDGQGDVLLSYEYEATTARKKGETDLDVVVPDDTIRIEIVIAPTKSAPAQAQRFIDYVRSDEGQKFFAEWGYGAPDATPGTFTIDDLGGWSEVNDRIFDPDTGEFAKLAPSA